MAVQPGTGRMSGMSISNYVLYAIEVDTGTGPRLLEQSSEVPFVFTSKESAENMIIGGSLDGVAVEFTASKKFPSP